MFSGVRTVQPPNFDKPRGLKVNHRMKMDGLKFLSKLPAAAIPVAFFDPQYRGILDKLQYGNEGKKRGQRRIALEQMRDQTITKFIAAIDRAY